MTQDASIRVSVTRMIEIFMHIAVPALLAVCGWMFAQIQDHRDRLTMIESNRYTEQDAGVDRGRLSDSINDLRIDLTEQIAKVRIDIAALNATITGKGESKP